MKKSLSLIMAGFFVATMFNATNIQSDKLNKNNILCTCFNVGFGTDSDPYQITTIEQLNAIRDHLNNNFLLMNDLDFYDDNSYNDPLNKNDFISGDGWYPIGYYTDGTEFTGSFDGQGYTISNLFVNRSFSVYSSLFGYILDAEVKHLKLSNVQVIGRGNAGSIAGGNERSYIFDCYASGDVKCSGYNAGGMVGWSNGTISNCHVSVKVFGDYYVGGLVGYNEGLISDSSATGEVIGNDFVNEIRNIGGLVGGNSGDIIDSYATGDVTGNTYVGGLVGANWQNISYCYATGKVTHVWHNYGSIILGRRFVGRLTGADFGTTINSYATGKLSIKLFVEGLFWYIIYQLFSNQEV